MTRVLYRCPTPTNVLCPCGAVERRLRKLDLEHATRRVPYGRSSRPEIEELTRQRRIREYLEWKYAKRESPPAGAEPNR